MVPNLLPLPLPEPWTADWPDAGRERLSACPICGATARSVWHEALVDNSFRVAAGRWTLWRCAGCGGAHLDPRPTPATIGAAYESYYTHAAAPPPAPAGRLAWLRQMRRRWSNGYANWRYGARRTPAAGWTSLVAAALLPRVRTIPDRELRHLPRPLSPPGRLLDVGCGDGAFLEAARGCGWQVLGIEPDPKAAQVAAARGVEVKVGGLDVLQGQAGVFDVITLSHVIEHLHDPVDALRSCHRLLKPGGRLWLETPNVDSSGHEAFGVNWRGLETPRHLVLFNPASMRRALAAAGFDALQWPPIPSPRRWMTERSTALAQGRWPDDLPALGAGQRLRIALADLLHDRAGVARREFITLIATKGR